MSKIIETANRYSDLKNTVEKIKQENVKLTIIANENSYCVDEVVLIKEDRNDLRIQITTKEN